MQPTVRDLRAAAKDLAVVTPRLTRSFKVLNTLFNTLAYNPPGDEEGYLFWTAWGAPRRRTLCSTQDAHGPVRRGLVLVRLPDLRRRSSSVVLAQPAARHAHRSS